MHNLPEQDTIPAKERTKLGSSAEPIKMQRLLSTLLQHCDSPVRCGSFHAKDTFEETHLRSLEWAVKLCFSS